MCVCCERALPGLTWNAGRKVGVRLYHTEGMDSAGGEVLLVIRARWIDHYVVPVQGR